VRSDASGYVQEIDRDRVLAAAREGTTIWLQVRPGDFVVSGSTLARVHPPPADADDLAERVRGAYLLGNDRTSVQDAGFAFQQLVEVALRALSPGVNEPFTAITCIDRLGQGLARLATRAIPAAVRETEGGPTIVAEPRTFEELLGSAFEPIAAYADRAPAIGVRLLATLRMLAETVRRGADRAEVARMADVVWELCSERIERARDKRLLDELRREVRRMASRPLETARARESQSLPETGRDESAAPHPPPS
jgi:uncharacterized membrane protein